MPPTFAPPQLTVPLITPDDPFNQPPNPPPSRPGVVPFAPRPPRKSSRGMFALLILGVMMISSGGVALAYFLWLQQPPKGPPPAPAVVETPDAVFSKALASWSTVQSYHGEFVAAFTLHAAAGSDVGEQLKNLGYRNNTVTATTTLSVDTRIEPPASAGQLQLLTTLPNAIPFNGLALAPQLSLVQVGTSTAYFRLHNLPQNFLWFDLRSIQDQWVRVTAEDLASLSSAASAGIVEEQAELAQRQQQRVLELYQQHPFLVAEKLEAGEPIDGVATRHLTLGFNREQFKAFFSSMWNEFVTPQLLSVPDMPKPTASMLEEYIDAISISAELWVSQPDNQLRRFGTAVTYTIPGEEKGAPQGSFTITVDATFSKINEPVTVTPPEQSIPLEEFMKNTEMLMTPPRMPGQPEEPAVSAPVDRDHDGLSDDEEQRWGTDPNNPDTDGDGYLDGQEVENGYNPNGPEKLTP